LNVPVRAAPSVTDAHRAAVFARPAPRYRRTRPRDRPGRPRVRSDARPGVQTARRNDMSCFHRLLLSVGLRDCALRQAC
jgi:hypothetical protein